MVRRDYRYMRSDTNTIPYLNSARPVQYAVWVYRTIFTYFDISTVRMQYNTLRQ